MSEVADWCGFSVSAASQQLRILERGELVVRRRIGQRICYDVNGADTVVRTLVRLIL